MSTTRALSLAALLLAAAAACASASSASTLAPLAGEPDLIGPKEPALRLDFSACRGFQTADGKAFSEGAKITCDTHAKVQKDVSGGKTATFAFYNMPEMVHCKTVQGDKLAWGKWTRISARLSTGQTTAHFHFSNKAGSEAGSCALKIKVGGEHVYDRDSHLYLRVKDIQGLNQGPSASHTKNPFLTVSYAGRSAGVLRASPGIVFDLGTVSQSQGSTFSSRAAAVLELLNGPGTHLDFTAVQLNAASNKGIKAYKLRSATHDGVGATVTAEFFVQTVGDFQKAQLAADKEAEAATENKPTTTTTTSTPKPTTTTTTTATRRV